MNSSEVQSPDLEEGLPNRITHGKTAGRAKVGLLGTVDVKDSSNILHALMAEVESKKTDPSVPCAPLCDMELKPGCHMRQKCPPNTGKRGRGPC